VPAGGGTYGSMETPPGVRSVPAGGGTYGSMETPPRVTSVMLDVGPWDLRVSSS
jgi:hypothetical protein